MHVGDELRSAPLAVQQAVVMEGGINHARNPNSLLRARIKKAAEQAEQRAWCAARDAEWAAWQGWTSAPAPAAPAPAAPAPSVFSTPAARPILT